MGQKNLNKILGSIMCIAVLGLTFINVSANETAIMPRAEICGNCDSGILIYEYQTVEGGISWGKCAHGKEGIDELVEIQHQYKVHCSNCAFSIDNWTVSYSDYRIDCLGY